MTRDRARPLLDVAPHRLVRSALLVALLATATSTVGPATAAGLDPETKLETTQLRDLRGEVHQISASESARATVIALTGVGCPVSEQYAPRLEQLHKEFAPHGVRFFGLNSNSQDSVEELRSFANRHELTFPLLKDHTHTLADRLGALRTTEVFLFDASLRLRYRGLLDDQYSITGRSVGLRKDRPENNHLVEALTSLLEGKPIAQTRTNAVGCIIGRKRPVTDATSITYYRDVAPIFRRRCKSCHRSGEIGPFSLETYDDARGWSGMIREVVVNRRMPPWHADPLHGRFSNDRNLDQEEVDTITGWIDNGSPAGKPGAEPPALEDDSDWKIGKPDVVYEIPEAVEVPATGTVPYKYFKVETNLAEDRWVEAAEVRAGNRAVVHHALVFAIDPSAPHEWRKRWRGGKAGYFAAMVPGERPARFRPGQAKRLPANSTLIFQVHYTTNGQRQFDRSRVGFVFAKKPVRHEVRTRSAWADWSLIIPPKASNHEVSARYTFTRDSLLLSFLPHMHIRGKSFRYTAHYPNSANVSREPLWDAFSAELASRVKYDAESGRLTWLGKISDEAWAKLRAMYAGRPRDVEALRQLRRKSSSETLLSVPRYDFGWQNTYRLAEPKRVPRGTLLVCTATFDNSANNPALTRDLWSTTVRWGEQTRDEMLIGYFDVVDLE